VILQIHHDANHFLALVRFLSLSQLQVKAMEHMVHSLLHAVMDHKTFFLWEKG